MQSLSHSHAHRIRTALHACLVRALPSPWLQRGDGSTGFFILGAFKLTAASKRMPHAGTFAGPSALLLASPIVPAARRKPPPPWGGRPRPSL